MSCCEKTERITEKPDKGLRIRENEVVSNIENDR